MESSLYELSKQKRQVKLNDIDAKACQHCIVIGDIAREWLKTFNLGFLALAKDTLLTLPSAEESRDESGQKFVVQVESRTNLPASSPLPAFGSIFELELYIDEASDSCPFADIPIRRHFSENLFAEENIDAVHEWLCRCEKNHTSCGLTEASPLPKRVIHVGSPENDPFLYEPELGETGRYICLSHRWGQASKPPETTKATISSHKEAIPFESLPLTFKDAIKFVRSLGFSYLWIDSLCIIQDDGEDWEIQAAKMGSIYENSVLTFLALQAADSTAGLSWPSENAPTTWITKTTRKGCTYTIWCTQLFDNMADADWKQLSPHSDHDVLFSRGWTFQESLLAPRLLLFTNQQLLWYCNRSFIQYRWHDLTMVDNFQGSKPMWSKVLRTEFQGQNSARSSAIEYANELIKIDYLLEYWKQLIESYSMRELTRSDDKFPAISAIAEKFSKKLQAKYLAGIWMVKDRIASQLLWEPRGYGSLNVSSNSVSKENCVGRYCFESRYRAPS